MGVSVFILLISICLGLIYLVHKYFGKEQFYLLGIMYSIISFVTSFKIVNVFGTSINANIIFSSGLLLILYYFVNRYSDKESRKFIITIIFSSLLFVGLFVLNAFMMPSIYDNMSVFYQSMILDNIAIVVMYPISLCVTMFLSEYCFKYLEKEESKKMIKTLLTILGIIFIDIAIFIYFSYVFIIKFDIAINIAIDNYLIKSCIMIVYVLIVNKLFMVRKVK